MENKTALDTEVLEIYLSIYLSIYLFLFILSL